VNARPEFDLDRASCGRCNGDGDIRGSIGVQTCPACRGSGEGCGRARFTFDDTDTAVMDGHVIDVLCDACFFDEEPTEDVTEHAVPVPGLEWVNASIGRQV